MYDDPAGGPQPGVSAGAVPAPTDAPEIADPPAIGDDRSPNPTVCPFLRAIDDGGVLGLPIEAPDPANRCAALIEPVPQSLRQQELVCLTSGHVNCPRYLRGSIGTNEPPLRRRGSRSATPAIFASLVLFVLAFAASVGFVIANGGLMLSAASPGPTNTGAVLGEVETSPPTAAPTSAATPIPTPAPTVTLSPSPTPSVFPSPTPTASATPQPPAKPTARPSPRSGRYALLKPCPDKPNCYIYTIRSGDNLISIANYFGVSLTTIKAWNPWIQNGLVVGRGLRIPPPTR